MAEKDFHISEKYNFRHALSLNEDTKYANRFEMITKRNFPTIIFL
jgi:hypothetical protein